MFVAYLPDKNKYIDRFEAYYELVKRTNGILFVGEGEIGDNIILLKEKGLIRKVLRVRRVLKQSGRVVYLDTFGVLSLASVGLKYCKGGTAIFLDAFGRISDLGRTFMKSRVLFMHDLWYVSLHLFQMYNEEFMIFQNEYIEQKYKRISKKSDLNTFVLPNSINTSRCVWKIRKNLDSEKYKKILSVGCNTESKGLYENFDYLQDLYIRNIEFEYTMVGVFSEDLLEKARIKYKDIFVRINVINKSISFSELSVYYNSNNYMLHLSVNEGMSRVVCEGISFGLLPILANHKINSVFFDSGIRLNPVELESNESLLKFLPVLSQETLVSSLHKVLLQCAE